MYIKSNTPSIGQKFIYDGEEGYIVRAKPLLVMKIRDRIVCGAIQKHLRRASINSVSMSEEHGVYTA